MNATDRSAARPPAIISPPVDLLCCGGFSILMIIGFLVYAQFLPSEVAHGLNFQYLIIGTVLVNSPHFMASYRLLYWSKIDIRQHLLASTYIPTLLVICGLIAVFTATDGYTNKVIVDIVTAIAAYLLAWHYTGQVWGMTASFLYISGIRIDKTERFLIRSSLRALLVWHLLWTTMQNNAQVAILIKNVVLQWAFVSDEAALIGGIRDLIFVAYFFGTAIAFSTILLGAVGFWKLWKRTGQAPPARAIVPWVAIWFWYLLVYYYPSAFIFLQISHALQYIIFPIRVEMNRYDRETQASEPQQTWHAIWYYVALIVVGVVVYSGPPLFLTGDDPTLGLMALISASISIHHYFIDGAIWKISNPHVRADLFAHLKSEPSESTGKSKQSKSKHRSAKR